MQKKRQVSCGQVECVSVGIHSYLTREKEASFFLFIAARFVRHVGTMKKMHGTRQVDVDFF